MSPTSRSSASSSSYPNLRFLLSDDFAVAAIVCFVLIYSVRRPMRSLFLSLQRYVYEDPSATTSSSSSATAHHHHHHHSNPHLATGTAGGHAANAGTSSPWRALRVVLLVLLVAIVFLNMLGVPEAAMEISSVLYNSPPGSFTQPSKIPALAESIRDAAHDNLVAVVALFCAISVTLLTFCIPGTIMLNVLFGALLGVTLSVPLCVALGAIGGTCCYGLSALAGTRVAHAIDEKITGGRGVHRLRKQVERHRADLFAYLLFLRLTPILPNWLINLASPVVGVPLPLFVLATAIGITPQTYLACRFGSVAHRHAAATTADGGADGSSNGKIVQWHDTLLIAVLGVMAVVINRLRKKFGDSVNAKDDDDNTAAAASSLAQSASSASASGSIPEL